MLGETNNGRGEARSARTKVLDKTRQIKSYSEF